MATVQNEVEKLRKEVESLHEQLNALECELIVESYEKRVYKAEVTNLNKSMARKVRQIRDLKEENRKLAQRALEVEEKLGKVLLFATERYEHADEKGRLWSKELYGEILDILMPTRGGNE